MTLIQLFNYHHHRILTSILKYSTTHQSYFELGTKMKLFNDKKQFHKSLELLKTYTDKDMKTFSGFTITQILKAYTEVGDYQRVLAIHHLLSSRIQNNPYNLTTLINFYMKCGKIQNAESLFFESKNKPLPMIGVLMKGYLQNNMPDQAIALFNRIPNPDDVATILFFKACAMKGDDKSLDSIKQVQSQIPQSFYSNPRLQGSLFDAFIKCKDSSSAEIVFSKMEKTVLSYGNLMNAFNKENKPGKTLALFDKMKFNGIEVNHVIYLCVVKALSEISIFPLCDSIVQQIPTSFLRDLKLQTLLIHMWGKVGYVNKAKEVFDKISQPDGFLYTAMINAYGLNGMGMEAIELFHQMPSKFTDTVTYVCVLNACSHAGLVDEARSLFSDIQNKTPHIYTTMVDCLSRASFFEEAQHLIDEFERHHSPTYELYMSLLSGARNEKNFSLSRKVFDRMKQLFPELTNPLTSAQILLANTYASFGEVTQASDIRQKLYQSGVKKKIGLSWTSVKGKIYQFRAHDRSHPRSSDIYDEVDQMSKDLLQHGHQYDSSWVTRTLDDDETVASALCGHSERLAIAWNFVEDAQIKQIHVSKNLRICGDCHRATKLLAAIRHCEIIVRDANRVHHFYPNGQCSCNDYF